MKNGLPYIIFIVCLLAIYFLGFGIDVMDIDAAQYANMSREMLHSKNPLFLYDVGQPYLDKPPFLIWVSCLSMKIFGANNFAYRLPSFLFAMLALYSTYRLASLFYNRHIALLSAVVLATCQGFFLMLHDVRTDTILMSWVVLAIWQLAAWYKHKKFINFIWGCVAIGFGMLTKGPIALFVPAFALGGQFILRRRFSMFLRWEYLVGILIIAAILLPMSLGLYYQFDAHPELVVNDSKGNSGLRFFYWTQSFGRITGESSWNNHATIFFQLQNMLWSFLPWIIFFILALGRRFKQLWQQKFFLRSGEDGFTISGFVLAYLSLGMSKYQLPHYIYVVFPLAAILTAVCLFDVIHERRLAKTRRVVYLVHSVLFMLLWLALIALLWFTLPIPPAFAAFALAGLLAFAYVAIKYMHRRSNLLVIAVLTSMGLNFFLNSAFYPALLKFQLGSTAGRYIHKAQLPADSTFIFRFREFKAVHFYAQQNIYHRDSIVQIQAGNNLLTTNENLRLLDSAGLRYDTLQQFYGYPVSRLKLSFLLPAKRNSAISRYSLIKIKNTR